MKKVLLSVLIASAAVFSVQGFSPYENYLLSGKQRHTMLIAEVKAGQYPSLAKLLVKTEKSGSIAAGKISNISSYAVDLNKKKYLIVYFDYDGKEYLKAVKDFEKTKTASELAQFINPLPAAVSRGNSKWLQLEWINYIRGAELKGEPSSRFAMVTRVKPEKEKEYRMLHQTTWPGIVDWMNRKGYHNFSIYIAYIGDEIYEFFYTETIQQGGKAATIKNMENDTAYKRWLRNTDACQNPLKGADGVWLMMTNTSAK